MVTPGLYRHYKDRLYRVLFVAEWAGRSLPSVDAVLPIGMREVYDAPVELTVGYPLDTKLFDARWSGNTCDVTLDERIVIYVALYGEGRVAARAEKEFEEEVDSGGAPELGMRSPRFERIGE